MVGALSMELSVGGQGVKSQKICASEGISAPLLFPFYHLFLTLKWASF